MEIFRKVKENQMDASCWDNVGSGMDATHTNNQNNALLNRSSEIILPLIHPQKIKHEWHMDDYLMRHFIIPYEYGLSGIKRLPFRINKRLKKLFGHEGPWMKKDKKPIL